MADLRAERTFLRKMIETLLSSGDLKKLHRAGDFEPPLSSRSLKRFGSE
jgi:hypothetical protein